MKKVLYIGWIGYKNLGDELMFDLFKEQMKSLGHSYQLDCANIEYRYLKNVSIQEYDLIVLGGGSIFGGQKNLIEPYIIDYLYHCLSLDKKIMIWGSGIDWAQKSFIHLLENDMELPIFVSKDLKEKIKTVFQKSVWAGVRGPLTLKILEQYGAKHHVQLSGDPAFLLSPPSPSKENNIIEKHHLNQHDKIIGVNWGTSFNNIYGQDEIKVENQLAKVLNQFIEKGYFIYLYTVWEKDLQSIERLYLKLKNQEKVIFYKTLYHQNQLLSILQNFSFTINFKLHANFLSLAANVPFIALGYRFKVFDFVKSIHHENFIISADEEDICNKIFSMESDILNNKKEILSNLNNFKELYRKKMTTPFQNGLYI